MRGTWAIAISSGAAGEGSDDPRGHGAQSATRRPPPTCCARRVRKVNRKGAAHGAEESARAGQNIESGASTRLLVQSLRTHARPTSGFRSRPAACLLDEADHHATRGGETEATAATDVNTGSNPVGATSPISQAIFPRRF